MPLLMAAPMKTPIEATISIRLKGAAFEPIAELRKLTASLLTPTDKSNIASRKRKTTTHRNSISIAYFVLCCKVRQMMFHKYCIKMKLCLIVRYSVLSVKVNARPPSRRFSTVIVPPCHATAFLTIDSPRPVPPAWRERPLSIR